MRGKYHHILLSPEKTHLIYSDGTPFFYLADTWWFGMTKRLSDIKFLKLLELRKKQGFTAIQIILGVPPEITIDSREAENTAGHGFR